MEIVNTLNGQELTIALKGELNSNTAPELEQSITEQLKGVDTLIFDFKELDYISSAGLRVLLIAKKVIDKNNGKLIVRHANEGVMDVFRITGFTNVLDFED